MRQLFLKTSIGEAIDKLSIIMLKMKYISDEKKLIFLRREYEEITSSLTPLGDYSGFLERLVEVNDIMWQCNEKRKKKIIIRDFDEEYVGLTVQESEVNDKRFLIKKEINEHYWCEMREQKSYEWIT